MRKKLLLLCLFAWSIAANAQIKPAQSYVLVERTNYTIYDYNTLGITFSLNYKKGDGTVVRSRYAYGSGYKVDTLFIVEDENKPARITIANSYNYSYWDCPPGGSAQAKATAKTTSKGEIRSEEANLLPPPGGDDCVHRAGVNYDMNTDINLRYPFFDTTFSSAWNNAVTVRVRVVPWLDNTNNLPSHDKILLSSETDVDYWQWSLNSSGPFNDIPSSCYRGVNGLQIQGTDIFPTNWMNRQDQAVFIRTVTGSTYHYLKLTHRISAPKIESVETFPNLCNGGYSGYTKIKFNRQLYDREQLNLFMDDTLQYKQFSAINLKPSDLDYMSSYTWKQELPAATYLLSMIGRYFDNTVELRVDSRSGNTPPVYRAVSFIDFNPGFESGSGDAFETELTNAGGSVTYTGNPQHYAFVQITQPPKIEFVISDIRDALCKGGNSGKFKLAARGGNKKFRYFLKRNDSLLVAKNFQMSADDIIPAGNSYVDEWVDGLTAGNYTISVRDYNGCMLYDTLGNELAIAVTIKEPKQELTFDLLEVTPITNSSSSDGQILINLVGGTPYLGQGAGFKYSFEWRDSTTNQIVSSWSLVNRADGIFSVKLTNLPEATYKFTAYDDNYTPSSGYSNRQGCTVGVTVRLIKPLPLTTSIVEQLPISCNDSADAQLLAKPIGGHQIDSIRYKFKWFKMVGGNPVDLNKTDSALSNVGPGVYKVEIKDKYDNTVAQQYTLNAPPALSINTFTNQASCYSEPTGSAWATVTGGVSPYTYSWSNGDTTYNADSLAGNKYIVLVRDARGCEATAQAIVTSPVQVVANPTIHKISCANKCDASISLAVSGGQAPYTYNWSNGTHGTSISNLCPGTYWYKVIDANGCYVTDTITFTNPAPLSVNAGVDRNICVGQTVRLNATVSGRSDIQYSWQSSNGYSATTPIATITQGGTYTVTISDSLNCILKDTVVLTPVSSTIQTEFLISTQAFAQENVMLVSMSKPTPDSVQWILPNIPSLQVIQKNLTNCELKFADTGRYNVTLRAFYSSGCIDEITKTVNVVAKSGFPNAGSQAEAYLRYFRVYPNPNSGVFNVELEFNAVTKARLRMINILNNMVTDDRVVEGLDHYTIPYNLGGSVIAGTYVLVIETPKGNFVYKVIIQ